MIPDFLKRENRKKPDETSIQLKEAYTKYKEHFGVGMNTEPSPFSAVEWVEIINECLEKNITVEEILGNQYNPDDDY